MKLRRVLPSLILSVVLIVSAACLLGCGGGEDSAETEADFGTSEIYDEATLEEVADLIEDEIASWGCELHKLVYMGDEKVTDENLAWMNEISAANGGPEYADVIAFKADYQTPEDAEEAGAWEPDTEMTDWEFWLARPEGGDWEIVTNGY